MTRRGFFITFEGGEGCGKTTQIQKLADRIKSIILTPFVVTREPGGAPSAELIRGLLVNGDAEKWRPATEGLLMSAARHEHVEQIIRPALAQNKLVMSDRFVDSTIVYQGIVGGVARNDIDAMNHIACGD
ncbi:MAG: dTMP kinase, partial [Alphaproteobacteria bacterium]